MVGGAIVPEAANLLPDAARGPRKDPPHLLLGRVVDVLRGGGYYSADEQARVLAELALALAGASGVMFMQQERNK